MAAGTHGLQQESGINSVAPRDGGTKTILTNMGTEEVDETDRSKRTSDMREQWSSISTAIIIDVYIHLLIKIGR